MEQLNKVSLRGIVGSARTSSVAERKILRMAVATNLAYRDKDGCAVIETTWHNVVAWESPQVCDLDSFSKGDKVEVVGRIRNQRMTREDGVEYTCSEIVATSLVKLESEEPLQYQY